MAGLVEVLWREAPPAFGFLVAEHAFSGPRAVLDGLRWERPGLSVTVNVWARHHGAGFATSLRADDPGGTPVTAGLDTLYAWLGLGPVEDVPEQVSGRHTVRHRTDQHAAALDRVLVALAASDIPATLRAATAAPTPPAPPAPRSY